MDTDHDNVSDQTSKLDQNLDSVAKTETIILHMNCTRSTHK